jgi:NIL domain
MSNLPLTTVQQTVLLSNGERQQIAIDINIPPHFHQQPVLATLIGNYNLIVNFQAAVLDRKATGGGWFNLSLEGNRHDLDLALNYLRNLDIEIFTAKKSL